MQDEWPTALQCEIYRKMTPAQKWAAVEQMRATAWIMKAAGIRAQHPDWTEAQIEAKVKEIFLYAGT